MKKRIFMMVCMLFLGSGLALSVGYPADAAVTYRDGEYLVSFEVLKDTSDEISATSDYMDSQATIVIEQGEAHAYVTLKNSSWWQEFKVRTASSHSFTDVVLVTENADNDTRTVKFPMVDLDQVVDAKIHIIITGIPGFEYDNRYDIRLKFDTESIPVNQNSGTAETGETESDEGTSVNNSGQNHSETTENPPSNPALTPNASSEAKHDSSEDLGKAGDSEKDSEQTSVEEVTEQTEAFMEQETNPDPAESDESILENTVELDSEEVFDASNEAADVSEERETEGKASSFNRTLIILLILIGLGLGVGGFFLWKTRKSS